jgi:hypothetical protein
MASARWRSELVSRYIITRPVRHTVNPFERVVDWVVDGSCTGEAKLRLMGCWTDLRAARLRRAWFRLKARRREAIAVETGVNWTEGRQEGGSRGRERAALDEKKRSARSNYSANHLTAVSNPAVSYSLLLSTYHATNLHTCTHAASMQIDSHTAGCSRS